MKRTMVGVLLMVLAIFSLAGGTAYSAGTTVVEIGTGTGTWHYPLATFYHDARTQTIYLASEIGSAGTLVGLSLDVATVPNQTMNAFTIRMKHTDLSDYSGTAQWESTGWTTVYQSSVYLSNPGWNTFNFTTPFDYNGTQNLMVDISFNNNFYTGDGHCYASTASESRSLYYRTDSGYGDPLTWAGTSPQRTRSTSYPNVQLHMDASAIAVTPEARTVPVTAGGRSFTVAPLADIAWTAEVISGESWLSIDSGQAGTGTGVVRLSYTANPETWSRTGRLRITAPDAQNSPVDVTVTQVGLGGYNLSVTTSGEGSVSPSGGIYDVDEVVTLTATPDDGSVFVGWGGALDGDTNPTSLTMDSDKVVEAYFQQGYSLSVTEVGCSVSRDPDKATYDPGETVTLTVSPNDGTVFDRWQGDASGNGSPLVLTMDSNKAVTAVCESVYSLDVSAENGSVTVEPDQSSYESGLSVTLTPAADDYYHFVGWSGDLSGTDSPATLVMDSDKSVTALFERDTHVIGGLVYTDWADPEGSGIMDVSILIASAGRDDRRVDTDADGRWEQTVEADTYTITPSLDGVPFSAVDADGNLLNQPSVTQLVNADDTDINFTGYATLSLEELPESAPDGGSPPALTSGAYPLDSVQSIDVAVEPGYRVIWQGTDNDSLTGPSNTVTMNEDREVGYAFERIPTEMTVQQFVARIYDSGPADAYDMFVITGNLNGDAPDTAAAIDLRVGSFEQSIAVESVTTFGTMPLYLYRGGSGGVSIMLLNYQTGMFIIVGQGLDIDEMPNPATIEIEHGSYYGQGQGAF